MTALDWIVILVLPAAWTALIEGLRLCLPGADEGLDDADEKRRLGLMLAPTVLGMFLVVIGHLAPVPVSTAHVLAGLPTWLGEGTPFDREAKPASVDFVPWLTLAGAAVYGMGLVRMAWPLAAAMLTLRRIATSASPVVCEEGPIYLTEARVPPLAWDRDRVILPRALYDQLTWERLRLIILHERAHLARRDTAWFFRLGVIDALFWFNPFVRGQTRRCRVAAEIACDAVVTRAAPTEREAYAHLLVGILKSFADDALPGVPAMSLSAKSGDYRMRLEKILSDDKGVARFGPKVIFATLTAILLPLAFVQFAWSQTPAVTPPPPAAADSGFKGLWTDGMLTEQDRSRAERGAEDPANMHRRVASEPRDAAWADAQEKAFYAHVGQYHSDAVDKVLAVAHCGSTLCEVDVKLGFKPSATRAQVRDAGKQLTTRLNGFATTFPGFLNERYSVTMDSNSMQKPWPDQIYIEYLKRKGV